jgi:hypothetical protein
LFPFSLVESISRYPPGSSKLILSLGSPRSARGRRGWAMALSLTGKGWEGVGLGTLAAQATRQLGRLAVKRSPHKSPSLIDGGCGGLRRDHSGAGCPALEQGPGADVSRSDRLVLARGLRARPPSDPARWRLCDRRDTKRSDWRVGRAGARLLTVPPTSERHHQSDGSRSQKDKGRHVSTAPVMR